MTLMVRVCISDTPTAQHAAAVARALQRQLHSTLAVPLQPVSAVDVWVQVCCCMGWDMCQTVLSSCGVCFCCFSSCCVCFCVVCFCSVNMCCIAAHNTASKCTCCCVSHVLYIHTQVSYCTPPPASWSHSLQKHIVQQDALVPWLRENMASSNAGVCGGEFGLCVQEKIWAVYIMHVAASVCTQGWCM